MAGIVWREDHPLAPTTSMGLTSDYLTWVFALHPDVTGAEVSCPTPGTVLVRVTTGRGMIYDAAIALALEDAFDGFPLLPLNVVVRVEPLSEQGHELHRHVRRFAS